ncbi:MAG TPA: DUF2306 domain-containing protein [Rhizomicrobium sp.]
MTVLYVSPDAPALVRYAADALLVLHIGGGTVGMLSGATALLARKGGRLHRVAGTAFFVSMLILTGIGACVSPFLPDGFLKETPNVIAGIMTFYLVLTSWMTIRRKDGGIGRFEIGGFAVASAVTAAGMIFIVVAMNSPTGTIGTTPPQAFYVFTFVGAIAAASDLKVILRGGISGAARIARHLWRMCAALTIASGSFFLGQQKVMPAFMHGSPWLFVPVIAPLALMVFWLIRIRFAGWYARPKSGAVTA